jgi:uncharacterized RDD family membrane protein YckC
MRQVTITTPEHVKIRLEPAGAGSRFLAVLIDALIVQGVAGVVSGTLSSIIPRGVAMAIFVTASFVLTWGWHVYFEVRRHGRTPGKRALSLRVIDGRGLPLSLYQSMVRNIARVVDFLPLFYGVAGVVSLARKDGRRLGDILAGTLVIRESQPLSWKGDLAARRVFNTLRTPRVQRLIRHRVSLEEREFLLALCVRAGKMSAAARYDLMEEVASAYRRKLDIEATEISGENLVRDLTAILFSRESART